MLESLFNKVAGLQKAAKDVSLSIDCETIPAKDFLIWILRGAFEPFPFQPIKK